MLYEYLLIAQLSNLQNIDELQKFIKPNKGHNGN